MPQNFAQWNVGDIILDLYKVIDVLGEGGFGKVYKVRHSGWNIDLAVKITKPEIVEAAGGVENFEREAGTWVNLGLHPHTVNCYYVRRINSIPVVFAEYVAGGSLHDWIYSSRLYAGGTEISLKRILDIAIQFTWGLHYAHEQGLIHQDVKPANVMVTPEGVVKVTDFGLANARSVVAVAVANNQEREPQASRVADSTLMVAGSGLMTPAYCSPEQANGNNLTRRTDLWSWALSVLEMFQGELTWAHGTVAAGALEYYLESGSENLQLPQMPILLAQLLRRCFRENPSERPHDMLEVANEVQSIYQQVIGEAYPQQQPQTAKDIADSLNNRAVSLFDLGKEEEALQLWEQALQVQPHHPESTYNRGLILWRSRKINDDTLVEALNDAQRSHAEDWKTKYLLGLVHLERDDCKAAIEILESIQGQEAQQEEVKSALALTRERSRHSIGQLCTCEGRRGGIGYMPSVCLSADNRSALSQDGERLKLWELDTGRCLRTFDGNVGDLWSLCLSPDNQFALSGSGQGTLKLWEVATGHCLRNFGRHTSGITSVCFSIDNQFALSGSYDETLKFWEVSTGHCMRTFGGHTDIIYSVYLSYNNQLALSGSCDQTLKLWELSTGLCLRTFKEHTSGVNSVCLSVDNRFALSGSSDKTLKLWELTTGHCLRTFKGHSAFIKSVCLSTDNQLALSGDGEGTLKLWEVATGNCLRTFEIQREIVNSVYLRNEIVNSVYLSSDNQIVICGNTIGEIRLWSVNFQENLYLAPMILSRILNTQTILSCTQKLKEAQMAVNRHDYTTAAQQIRTVRSQLEYSRNIEALNIWKNLYIHLPLKKFLNAWESMKFKGHTSAITSSCLSIDNQFAVSGSTDKTLKLWELSTGHCLHTFEGHTDEVTSVCLSIDNQFAVSGSTDKMLKLWELSTGHCLHTFEGHTDEVTSVCLTPDNQFVVSGSTDKTLKLWELSTGNCLHTFEGHTGGVTSVCLSPDNQFVVSGSYWYEFLVGTDIVLDVNGRQVNFADIATDVNRIQIKQWKVETGKCLHTFEDFTGLAETGTALPAAIRYILKTESDDRTGIRRKIMLYNNSPKCCIISGCLSVNSQFALLKSSYDTFNLWEVATRQCLHTFKINTSDINSVNLSVDNQFALFGSCDNTLRLWVLDWELEDKFPDDWDEGARPYLENFLTLQTPYAATLPKNSEPLEEEVTLALTRRGIPTWSEEDFQNLLYTLGCAGYGWLRPEGICRQLEAMVENRRSFAVSKSLPASSNSTVPSQGNQRIKTKKTPNKLLNLLEQIFLKVTSLSLSAIRLLVRLIARIFKHRE